MAYKNATTIYQGIQLKASEAAVLLDIEEVIGELMLITFNEKYIMPNKKKIKIKVKIWFLSNILII